MLKQKNNTTKTGILPTTYRSRGFLPCGVGEKSWLAKKYGKLSDTWQQDLRQGFTECMRVLKPYGTLVFKWNEQQIKLSEVLKCFNRKPIFGDKRAATHWLVFMKLGQKDKVRF